MWDKITATARAITALIAAMAAAGTLIGWLNQAMLDHLDATFATKADVQHLEQKIDSLHDYMLNPTRKR